MMDLNYINKIILSSLGLSVVFLVCFSVAYGMPYGLAILAGTAWGCLNLVFIKYLVKITLNPGPKDSLKVFSLMAIKFPLLYFIGYVLLRFDYFPTSFLALGFTIIILVIFLKGAGRLVMER